LSPLLLGFDQKRWAARKAKLRNCLAKESTAAPRTVKNSETIESENVSYWMPDHQGRPSGMSDLRWRFSLEAKQARKRWAEHNQRFKHLTDAANSPVNAPDSGREPSVTCSPGESGRDIICNIGAATSRRCRICGEPFKSTRSDASFCGAKCRVRASRARNAD
jgi:hypothetical protein